LLRVINDAVQGGADRVLSMAERQEAHRQEYEITALQFEIESTRRAQWQGTCLSALFVLGAMFSVWMGTASTGINKAVLNLAVPR
jgi:uncharacterized membrane protein